MEGNLTSEINANEAKLVDIEIGSIESKIDALQADIDLIKAQLSIP